VAHGDIERDTFEDFESYPAGTAPGPLLSVGAQVSIGFPSIGSAHFNGFGVETNNAWVPVVTSGPPCISGKCLGASISPLYSPFFGTPTPPVSMTFNDFLPGTTGFGVVLPEGVAPLSIAVQGATSSLFITDVAMAPRPGGISYGFADSEGMLSVTFTGAGAFDDAITAQMTQMAPIPLPPAGALLLIGLAGFAVHRRRVREA
jgi:hypothetical protein